MSISLMVKTRASIEDELSQYSWQFSELLSTPGNGSSILIPNGAVGVGIMLYIQSGSGKLQTTTDTIESVYDGSAIWVDSPVGVVDATFQDYAKGITAIRQVNVSGTTRLLLRAS